VDCRRLQVCVDLITEGRAADSNPMQLDDGGRVFASRSARRFFQHEKRGRDALLYALGGKQEDSGEVGW
jgi:hypothetical protein